MRHVRKMLLVGICCFSMGGCDKSVTSPQLDLTRLSRSERFAVAVAQALQSPLIATALKDRLRESPYLRHKVSLQALVIDERNTEIAAALAEALNTSPAQLVREINAMPPLDLWMPSADQRRTWRGTPGAVVVVQFAGEPPPRRAFEFERADLRPQSD